MRFTLSASLALILTVAASSMSAGQSASGQSPVTFTKDIAPIFQEQLSGMPSARAALRRCRC